MAKFIRVVLVCVTLTLVRSEAAYPATDGICDGFAPRPESISYDNPFGLPGSTCEYFDWSPPKGMSCRELCETNRADLADQDWDAVLKGIQERVSRDSEVTVANRETLDTAITITRVQLDGTCKQGKPVGPAIFKPQPAGDQPGWQVFGTSVKAMVVIKGMTPVTEASHLLAYLDFLQVTLSRASAKCIRLSVNELSAIVGQWDNFHKHGYSQYPWEVWLNGLWRADTDIRPPRFQVVVAHPTLGMQASGPMRDLMVGNLGPLVETVGALVYTTSRSYYFGANQIVMLSGDRPPGYGFNLHVGRLVSAGYVWRSGTMPEGKDTFIIGVDIGKALIDDIEDEGLKSLNKVISQ